jgi:peptide/nickel transport system substrate-binding protein
MAVMALSACGGSTHTGPAAGTAKFGGTVVDGLYEEPDNIIVGQSTETFAQLFMASIWAPLVWEDSHGLLQPGLLTEVPSPANGGYSADFKTLTLHLRPNLMWSDGSPLTAQDVLFTINLLSNPDYAQKTGFESSEVQSVTAPDNTTIVIHLKVVDVAFVSFSLTDVLDFSPIPQSIYGSMKAGDILKSRQGFMPPVSSGPFTITERVKGDHLTVVKNPHYYLAPKPYLNKMIFKIIPDQNTILTALQSGQIDTAWDLDINKLAQYRAISGYTAGSDSTPGSFEMIVFNLYSSTNHILEDINVRKAIKDGINLGPIVQQIWARVAVPDCDDAPGTFAHATDLIPCQTYDPTQAGQLLDSAGWTMGSDGYRHKGGKTLELRYSTTSSKAYRVQTETLVQQQLKAIGIKIDIVNYTADTYFGTILPNGTFDIGEYASAPTAGDPADFTQWDCDQFTPQTSGLNYMHWCDQTATAADKTALTNPDQTLRKNQYHILYSEIRDQVPAVFYYAYPNIWTHNTAVQNYVPGPAGPSETVALWDWWRTDA